MGLTDLCFRGLSQAAGLISLKSQEVKSEKDFSLSLAFLAMTDKRSCDPFKNPAPGPVEGKQKSPGQEADANDFVWVGKISLLHLPMRYTSLDQIHKEVYA